MREYVMLGCWGVTIGLLIALLIAISIVAANLSALTNVVAKSSFSFDSQELIADEAFTLIAKTGISQESVTRALTMLLFGSSIDFSVAQMLNEIGTQVDPRETLDLMQSFVTSVQKAFPTNNELGYSQSRVQEYESVTHYYATMASEIITEWQSIEWADSGKAQTAPASAVKNLVAAINNQVRGGRDGSRCVIFVLCVCVRVVALLMLRVHTCAQLDVSSMRQLGSTCVTMIESIESAELIWKFNLEGPGIESDEWTVGDGGNQVGTTEEFKDNLPNAFGFNFPNVLDLGWLAGINSCTVMTAKTDTTPSEAFCFGSKVRTLLTCNSWRKRERGGSVILRCCHHHHRSRTN